MRTGNSNDFELDQSDLFVDLANRIKNGERNVAASILSAIQDSEPDSDFVIDLIYQEYLVLEELNEVPEVEGYCQRFPEHAVPLKRLLEVHLEFNESEPGKMGPTLTTTAGVDDTISDKISSPGKVVGRYQLVHQIGHGGSSRVYKAWQIGLDRMVAIKLLNVNDFDKQLEIRFKREAEVIARLQHPNIVQLHDYGCADGQFYLVMELLDGGGLDRPADEPMTVNRICELMIKLAWAIHFAHGQSVIHRDLKPSNVLVTASGEPKIADFGLAKCLEASQSANVTKSGTTIGTPSYIPPEQIAGDVAASPATDVYGLGAIFYQLLTSRPPFLADDVWETLRLVRETDPVPPSQLRANLPRDLEVICLRCLSKDPAKRFDNARELALELERFRGGVPIESRPTSYSEKFLTWCRRRPLVAALWAALAISLVGGMVGVAWQWQEANAQAQIAGEKRRQSKLNFDKARQAIDRLTEINVKLETVPGTDELRQQALREVLKFYLDHIDKTDDPEVAFEAANAYSRIADIRAELNEYEIGFQDSLSAFEIYSRLHSDNPGSRKFAISLADSYFQLGIFRRILGFRQESAESFLKAADMYLIFGNEDEGESPRYQSASALNNAASLYLGAGDMAKAKELMDRALERFEKLADGKKPSWRFKLNQALTLESKALLLQREGKLSDAIDYFQQAVDMIDQATDGGAKHHATVRYLVRTLSKLTIAQYQTDSSVDVWWPNVVKAHQLLRRSWSARPDRPQFGEAYATFCRDWAHRLWLHGEEKRAEPYFGDAFQVWSELHQRFPEHFSRKYPDDDVVGYKLGLLLAVCPVEELRDPTAALDLGRQMLNDRPESMLAQSLFTAAEALYGDVDAADQIVLASLWTRTTSYPEPIRRVVSIAITYRKSGNISADDQEFLEKLRDERLNYGAFAWFYCRILTDMIDQEDS